MQSLIVGLVVIACVMQAVWVLMPARARATVASRLLALPLPAFAARHLRRSAVKGGCGGCDSCGSTPVAKATTAQPIRIHRRR